jgi:hypothetical protein
MRVGLGSTLPMPGDGWVMRSLLPDAGYMGGTA